MVNKRFKNRSWRRNVGSNECWEHVIYVKLYTFFRHFLLIFNTQILSAFLLISFALCFFFRSIARSGIQLAYKSSHFVLLFVRCCSFSLHFTSPFYICFDSFLLEIPPNRIVEIKTWLMAAVIAFSREKKSSTISYSFKICARFILFFFQRTRCSLHDFHLFILNLIHPLTWTMNPERKRMNVFGTILLAPSMSPNLTTTTRQLMSKKVHRTNIHTDTRTHTHVQKHTLKAKTIVEKFKT